LKAAFKAVFISSRHAVSPSYEIDLRNK